MLTVSAYSRTALSHEIVTGSHSTTGHSVSVKPHIDYLDEYLTEINAQAILVESEYTDRDYLEDYAAYYARCFTDYRRTCRRLHFFSRPIVQADIDLCFNGDVATIASLQGSYLGFVVVKPLPYTVVGRTCLVPYNDNNRTRIFPCTHDIPVNICGLDLVVRSLPFQEQDKDVAACATSSLWSIFNSTGRTFQHQIPSPVEITRVASAFRPSAGRSMPAERGLTAEQCGAAIRDVGLEPQVVAIGNVSVSNQLVTPLFNPALLQLYLHAYMKGGLPALLLGALYQRDPATQQNQYIGHHAMAVLGYSPSNQNPSPFGTTGILFESGNIDRLYVHDDGVGPFARLAFDQTQPGLVTSWQINGRPRGTVQVCPELLVFPLYHKIRVPLSIVTESLILLDHLVESLRLPAIPALQSRIVWDVFLTDVQDYKESAFKNNTLPSAHRIAMLQKNLPRYLWVARANVDSSPVFDLLYDATDLLQGTTFLPGIPYDLAKSRAVGAALSHPQVVASLSNVGPEKRIGDIGAWLNSL